MKYYKLVNYLFNMLCSLDLRALFQQFVHTAPTSACDGAGESVKKLCFRLVCVAHICTLGHTSGSVFESWQSTLGTNLVKVERQRNTDGLPRNDQRGKGRQTQRTPPTNTQKKRKNTTRLKTYIFPTRVISASIL